MWVYEHPVVLKDATPRSGQQRGRKSNSPGEGYSFPCVLEKPDVATPMSDAVVEL
jgi:hypothetical protein